jgi:hypothetical protein
MHRTVAWSKNDPIGAEIATVGLSGDRMHASGVAIGSDPEPYRLDYELETTAGLLTSRVLVSARGERWSRRIELTHKDGAGWRAEVSQEGPVSLPDAGGELSSFDDAIDPDLGLSPLFNTMPVVRHRIHEGGTADDFLMVWISVPDLSLHASPQRYRYLETRAPDERVIRFEAVGEDDDFAANVIFDADGLVVDYPGIAARIRAARPRE